MCGDNKNLNAYTVVEIRVTKTMVWRCLEQLKARTKPDLGKVLRGSYYDLCPVTEYFYMFLLCVHDQLDVCGTSRMTS